MTKKQLSAAVAGALAAIGLSVASLPVQAAPTTVNLGGAGGVTYTTADGGYFTDTSGQPALSWNGAEYVAIDVKQNWWWLAAPGVLGSPFVGQEVTNNNPLATTTFPSGPLATFTTNQPAGFQGLIFTETVSALSSNQVGISIKVANNSGNNLANVDFGFGLDPDQGGSGHNATFNQILGQAGGASVRATYTGAGYGVPGPFVGYFVTLSQDTGAGADAVRAVIGSDCCTPVDPTVALGGAAQAVGFNTYADDSISLAYHFASLNAGQTATIGYTLTFGIAPIPEPETYAMLIAGLGLMGFIARRRKQNDA